VTKGSRSLSFFSLPEYQEWLESTGNNGKGYKIKYYKGLGTSTSAEAKEYFSSLDLHEVNFANLSLDVSANVPDVVDAMNVDAGDAPAPAAKLPSSGADLIDLVFRKDRVSDRKEWLNTFNKETYLDYREVSQVGELKYSDFINKEYIIFSTYDNERSIPNVMDGFKPSQRKVLFACFKRKLKNEIKVAQLTGYVAEHSAYHHGEQSLQQTIVGLAQNFVGSNNVNLLTPAGQFGTRRMGGKDAASARYIFTCLEPITRAIFHPDDDDLLTYQQDDGATIEPEFYVPVIPMVLVNGSAGIGSGYSSNVENYNPRDIIANLRRKLNGEPFQAMTPYYYGFQGDVLPDPLKAGKFKILGKIERVDDTTVLITELPLQSWTQDYKQFLETLLTGSDKQPAEIKDFKENHTESTVRFTVVVGKETLDGFEKGKDGLMGKFKLNSSVNTGNMNLFDPEKHIVKYATPVDIMTEFFQVRLDFYGKRKVMLVGKLEREQRMLSNKARFVEEVCSGSLVVSNRKRNDLLGDLQARGYDTFLNDAKKTDETTESEGDEISDSDLGKGYDYLLGMKIWSLTFEKAEKIRAELAEKTVELEALRATSPEQLWLNDLDAVDAALDRRDLDFAESAKEELRAQKKSQNRKTKKAAPAAGRSKGKAKKKNEWDSDMEESESEDDDGDDDSLPPARKPAARRPAPAAKKPAAPSAASAKPPAKSSTVGAASSKASAAAKPAALPAKSSAFSTVGPAGKAIAPKAKSVLEQDPDSGSDDEIAPRKPAAAKKPTANAAASKAKATASASAAGARQSDSDDSDDDAGMGLMERLKKLGSSSPKTKASAVAQAKKPAVAEAKNPKKRSSPKNEDSDDDDSNEDSDNAFVLASVTPAKDKLAKTGQVAKKARSKAPPKASSKPAATSKKTAPDLDFQSDHDDSSDEGPAAPPAARARSARAATKKPVVYEIDESDEDDDSEDD
jgi:DNA topoisomerase-2